MAFLKDLFDKIKDAAASASKGSGTSKTSGSSGGSGASGGKNTYDDRYMSGGDYKLISKYGDDWNAAKAAGDEAGMKAAHDAAEALRSKYNYSGGADGSQYIQTGPPVWGDKYQKQIDDLLGSIASRDPFSYDPEKDPLFQQFRTNYTMEGQRAMQDTLGQIAARTGGLASSYAGSAAQQANNYYMAQLSNKIPELQQLAYSMYRDDGNDRKANLELLMALQQRDYARYQDLLGQYNADRQWNYQTGRDQIADDRYNKEWDYSVGRDRIADDRYNQELAYQQAMDRWQLTGRVSAADAAVLGVPAGTSYGVYRAAKSGGGSSGGSKTGKNTSGGGKKMSVTTAKDMAKNGQFTDEVLATLRAAGYNDDYIREVYGWAGREGGGLSRKAQALYNTMSSAPGLTPSNKAAMIEDSLNKGNITEEEAQLLADYFGV